MNFIHPEKWKKGGGLARGCLIWLMLMVIVLLSVALLIEHRSGRADLEPEAPPRAVTARGDLADDERATIEIFRNASPSVVFITSVELRRSFFSLNVYEIPSGTGSGFVWDRKGRIVTNYHVIEDAGRIEVTLADKSVWKARLVGVAPDKDLAVVEVDAPAERLEPLALGSSADLMVGQKTFAIGNPFGLDQTLTSGIVSAVGREIKSVTGRTIQDVIQTDAAINPGNSGGPLLDSAGRLIGVNTLIYSPSGANAGIGFAVPVDTVNSVVTQLIRHGRLIQPGIGVTVANRRVSQRLGIEGILIVDVLEGSPAGEAGLRATKQIGRELVLGDIILSIDGEKVENYDELRNAFDRHEVGETVNLEIERDGRIIEVEVRLEDMG